MVRETLECVRPVSASSSRSGLRGEFDKTINKFNICSIRPEPEEEEARGKIERGNDDKTVKKRTEEYELLRYLLR